MLTDTAKSVVAQPALECQMQPWVVHPSIFLSHSHLIRKARPSSWRLWIPKPPSGRGRATHSQFVGQWPSRSSFLLRHRNALLHLLTALINHLGTSSAMRRYMGITISTARTRMRRPEVAMIADFQPSNSSAILSRIGCRSTLVSLHMDDGIPQVLACEAGHLTWQLIHDLIVLFIVALDWDDG